MAGLGVVPPIIVWSGDVAVTETDSGYLAEVTPPSGETAQGMADALPGLSSTADVLKTTLNSLVSDLNVESITICVDIPSAKVKVLPVAVQFVCEKRFVVTPVCP